MKWVLGSFNTINRIIDRLFYVIKLPFNYMEITEILYEKNVKKAKREHDIFVKDIVNPLIKKQEEEDLQYGRDPTSIYKSKRNQYRFYSLDPFVREKLERVRVDDPVKDYYYFSLLPMVHLPRFKEEKVLDKKWRMKGKDIKDIYSDSFTLLHDYKNISKYTEYEDEREYARKLFIGNFDEDLLLHRNAEIIENAYKVEGAAVPPFGRTYDIYPSKDEEIKEKTDDGLFFLGNFLMHDDKWVKRPQEKRYYFMPDYTEEMYMLSPNRVSLYPPITAVKGLPNQDIYWFEPFRYSDDEGKALNCCHVTEGRTKFFSKGYIPTSYFLKLNTLLSYKINLYYYRKSDKNSKIESIIISVKEKIIGAIKIVGIALLVYFVYTIF